MTPIPLTSRQRRALRLQDKAIAEFYADKSVMAIIGAMLPGLAGGAVAYLTGHLSPIPAIAAVVGGVIGFFVPTSAASSHHQGPPQAHAPMYIDLD
jgi:hypothetical protein